MIIRFLILLLKKVSGIHIMVEVSKMLSLMLSVMPKNES